ncbi:uncharacterized protein LOC116625632 [Phoca vitulina]|uniref:uncharacterized protein LOC116625632 n=1 Tax=Phoca vitulina TaxID=9720 RepID=UPI001396633F|nr:uncharacterized protein LOC116625632 [Phoca vitulina]
MPGLVSCHGGRIRGPCTRHIHEKPEKPWDITAETASLSLHWGDRERPFLTWKSWKPQLHGDPRALLRLPRHRPELNFSDVRKPGRRLPANTRKREAQGHGRGVDPPARARASCGTESPRVPAAWQSRQPDSPWPGVVTRAGGSSDPRAAPSLSRRRRKRDHVSFQRHATTSGDQGSRETPLPASHGAASTYTQVSRSHAVASWPSAACLRKLGRSSFCSRVQSGSPHGLWSSRFLSLWCVTVTQVRLV